MPAWQSKQDEFSKTSRPLPSFGSLSFHWFIFVPLDWSVRTSQSKVSQRQNEKVNMSEIFNEFCEHLPKLKLAWAGAVVMESRRLLTSTLRQTSQKEIKRTLLLRCEKMLK